MLFHVKVDAKPIMAVGVLFSPMVSGCWVVGRVGGRREKFVLAVCWKA